MPVIKFNKEIQNMETSKNDKRKNLRSTDEYKYIIRTLKRIYKNDCKNSVNPSSCDNWNDIAHRNGIYYIVEQNQDIINVRNAKMMEAIIYGRFDRYDYQNILED